MYWESSSKVWKYTINSAFILELQQNDDIGCSVGLEDDNNLFVWNIVFEGPSDTLYEVSIFAQL